jgi:hypothetical protein
MIIFLKAFQTDFWKLFRKWEWGMEIDVNIANHSENYLKD